MTKVKTFLKVNMKGSCAEKGEIDFLANYFRREERGLEK